MRDKPLVASGKRRGRQTSLRAARRYSRVDESIRRLIDTGAGATHISESVEVAVGAEGRHDAERDHPQTAF